MEVVLFIEKQLQLLSGCLLDLYFDATGNVVRPPNCHEHFKQRVYYYAGVIRCKGEIIPVMELISCLHDTATLIAFLCKFRKEFQAMYPTKPKIFNSITTDWSWAAINALTLAFNNMSFTIYLNEVFKGNQFVTPLHICYSHFMKIICDLSNKTFKGNEELNKFIKDIFRLLANSSTLAEAEIIYISLVEICSSEYLNLNVET